TFDAGELKMDMRIRVERQPGDDVRMNLRNLQTVDKSGSISGTAVQLRLYGGDVQGGREHRIARAARSAKVLRSIFEGKSPCHLLVGVIKEPEAGNTAPSQAGKIVHVKLLAVEQISRQSRDLFPVWRHHAPGLAGKKLKMLVPDINPVEAHPIHNA